MHIKVSIICLSIALQLIFISQKCYSTDSKDNNKECTPCVDMSTIAAMVNSTYITKSILDMEINNLVRFRKKAGNIITETEKDILKKELLEKLISTELLFQESSKKISFQELTQAIDKKETTFKNTFDSEEELQIFLKDNNITMGEIKSTFIKESSVEMFLNKHIFNNIKISDGEKKQYYEQNKDKPYISDQVRAQRIVLIVPKSAGTEEKIQTKNKLELLRTKVLQGEDFAKLAKENSGFTEEANKGGDTGYFRKTEKIKPVSDTAFGLEIGAVSNMIEAEFGQNILYMILKVTDKKPSSYENTREIIQSILLDTKKAALVNELISNLKKSTNIKIYIE